MEEEVTEIIWGAAEEETELGVVGMVGCGGDAGGIRTRRCFVEKWERV